MPTVTLMLMMLLLGFIIVGVDGGCWERGKNTFFEMRGNAEVGPRERVFVAS